jgi:hypothetical protein
MTACAEDPELWAILDEAIETCDEAKRLYFQALQVLAARLAHRLDMALAAGEADEIAARNAAETARSDREVALALAVECARRLLEEHDDAQVRGSPPA